MRQPSFLPHPLLLFLLPLLLLLPVVQDDMPTAPVAILDDGHVIHDSPTILPPFSDPHDHGQDVHDIDIHAPPFSASVPDSIPVLSIHEFSLYYSSFPDCGPFSHSLPPYPYPQDAHVPHPDSHFVRHDDSNTAFVHNTSHLSPKHLHHSQDFTLRGISSLHDSRFHSTHSPPSLAYLPPRHDLTCSPDQASPPFSISSPPPKPLGLAHTLLPPIVQSNPAELSRADIEVSLSVFSIFYNLSLLQNRPTTKRTVASSSSQVDPCAAAFLRDQLGEAKWDTFCARLFERRLGPIKSKIRVRGKNSDDAGHPPGATAIDFLVKVEVVKEVLRTYVPYVFPSFSACSRALTL